MAESQYREAPEPPRKRSTRPPHQSRRTVPTAPAEGSAESAPAFLEGGGEMGARIRAFNWARTPLGPIEQWPHSLKTSVRIMLTARQPMFVWWGEKLINLYNDAYLPIVGVKHPAALGKPAKSVWREIWKQVGPRAQSALTRNEGTFDESLLLIMERNGYPEETYFTFSYSPVPHDAGGTGGIICACTDDTLRILGERQLSLLGDLAMSTANARTGQEACVLAASALEASPEDLPFAAIYLLDDERKQLVVAGQAGIEGGHPAAPRKAACDKGSAGWPFAEALAAHAPVVVPDLAARFADLPAGAWQQPPHQGLVIPIAPSGPTGQPGVLVVGLNPYRLFDDKYGGFLSLVAGQIGASIANATAYEEERKRAETLAELNRAKTTFFSNVSHEFRTPLTLILGPVEDMLTAPPADQTSMQREQVSIVHRNSLRLLKLVNTLLDFARIEAGRLEIVYEPTDLAAATTDLAAVFRAACQRAGLELIVDCPPLSAPVHVDRAMWEKIVLNLVSNAFKYTQQGGITVRLREVDGAAQLQVRDTGIGIPQEALPRIFERFYRVEGARGRTKEGSGIGLALTSELARLHGGSVSVDSSPGAGSTFTVSIPIGVAHLPPDRLAAPAAPLTVSSGSEAFVQEALRWLPDAPADGNAVIADAESHRFPPVGEMPTQDQATAPRVLVVDDNADMRDYVRHVLQDNHTVETAGDGQQALDSARRRRPDLVVTDVMMPGMDGFALLRALRADPDLANVPIIMLSGRAGEESKIEGLDAGADDYLVKPFSARELLARVSAQVTMSRLRGAALTREHALRSEAELLNDVSRILTTELDLQRLVQKITTTGQTITGAAFGAFYHDGDEVGAPFHRLVALTGHAPAEFKGSARPIAAPYFEDTLRGEGVVRIADLGEDPLYGKDSRYASPAEGQTALRSYLAVPVVSRGGIPLGGLFFGHPRPGVFSERAERLALGLAAQAAIALDNAKLYASSKHEIERRARVEVALRESEERYRELVEGLPAAVFTCDAHGKIQLFNEAAISLWSRVPEAGEDFCSGAHRYLHLDGVPLARDEHPTSRVLRDGHIVAAEELIVERSDGARRIVLAHAHPIHDAAGAVVGAVNMFVDISDRKQAEAQLLAVKDELAAELAGMFRLHEISTRLVQKGDLRSLLPELAQAAIDITHAEMGHIQLLDEATQTLHIVGHHGMEGATLAHFAEVPANEPCLGRKALARGERVIVEDLLSSSEPVPPDDLHALQMAGVRALQFTPLISRTGQPLGLLSTFYRQPYRQSERELRLLDLLARQASDLIAKARTKDDLRRSEARIRSLLALLPTAVYACDAEGRITFFNKRAAALWGEEPKLQDDHQKFCAFYKVFLNDGRLLRPEETPMAVAVRTGEAFRDVEALVERRDGSRFVARVNIDPLRDADGRLAGAINVFEDISQRRQDEQALRDSEERLRLATETGKVGVWDWDIPSGRMSWTDSLYTMHGVNSETFPHNVEDFIRLVHPEDRAFVELAIQRTLQTDAPYEIEFRAVRPTGETVWLYTSARVLREDGRPMRMLGATVDVTRQKASEAALRRSEEQFRMMADCIPQLAWMARPDGHIFWYNQRWYAYTGATAEQMEGWGWQSVHDPAELQRMLPKFKAAIASGEPWEDTFPLRRRDGAMRWHLSRALPLRDESGRIVRWFGTNTDITEQRETAAALQEAKDVAEAANMAKDRFLAILSHELRTPLTPVLMAAGAIEKNTELPTSVREDAAMIKDNIRLETKLIDDLLDLSRIASGKLLLQPESVDLNDVVLHVCGMCAPLLQEKSIHLHCAFDENVGAVRADSARLQQVLWNVLRNAAKFTPEDGNVFVTTSVLPQGKFCVSFRDTGIGIAPEALTRIFEAFEQADQQVARKFGGLGLGLAISKAILELHQGTIRAESRGDGQGATFLVELPAESVTLADAPEEVPAEPEDAVPSLRLLVVDDHDGTARMLERVLNTLGYEVRSAGCIADALQLVETESFDMLISDIGLPDGSGYELIRQVHERKALKSIAVSGYGMSEDMERSREAGFDEHLVKPLDINQLDKAIRRLSQREDGGHSGH